MRNRRRAPILPRPPLSPETTHMNMNPGLSLAVLAASLLPSSPMAQDHGKQEPAKLRIVAIPDATTVKDDQEKFAKWLGSKVGVPVEFTSVPSYEAAVTALATGNAELGWLGGVTTVQAMNESKGKVVPVVTTENNLRFKSYVIANKSLGAKKMEDLKGKSFTFGAKGSTSGHVMARHCLEKAGYDPEKFFGKVAYGTNHTKTVLDVAGGAFDCGVLNYSTFDKMLTDEDPKKASDKKAAQSVDIVWTTPEYVDYAWNVRTDIDERCGKGATEKIKAAFLGLDNKKPEDAALLKIYSGTKYVAVEPKQWDGVKAVMEKIDVTK